MTGSISINLPLKPYLIKYLTKKYGNQHVVSQNSWLGIYVIDLLDKQYRRSGSIKDGDYYTLVVPKTVIKEVGFDMPPSKYNKLETMIDKLFRNDLYSYIEVSIDNNLLIPATAQINHKQNVMQAIKQFFKSYKITEDDVRLESIYRDHTRYIKKNRTHTTNPNLNRLAV